MGKENVVKSEDLDGNLAMRINNKDLEAFKLKSSDLGKPYQIMIREIITAFNENRVRIIPTNEQKKSLRIYKP